MRYRKDSEGGNIGPVRRVFRGIFLLLAAPVFIGVGLIMLPFVLIARLLEFRGPKGHHGFGCSGRGKRQDTHATTVEDAGATA